MGRRIVLVAAGVAALALAGAAVTVTRAGEDSKKEVHKVVIFRSGGSWLGVQIADVDAARAKDLGLKEEMGAEVQSVVPGSPAEEAGLQKGDVVLEYQGTRIEGVTQLTRLVRETPAGRTATLKVFRDGSTRTVQAKVGEQDHGDGDDFEKHIEITGGPDGTMHLIHPPGTPAAPMPPMPTMPPVVDLDELDIPGLMDMAGSAGRPRLGASVDSVGKQLAQYFGVKQGSGVLVTSVKKGGPGDTAGLKAGDVIVKVEDETVDDTSDLHMALRDRRDKEVHLTVIRDRREQTLTIPVPPPPKPSERSRGPSGVSAIDREAMSAQIRQALAEAENVRIDRAAIKEQVEQALRQAREAARAAEELRRETGKASGDDDAVEIRAVPEQEREAIRRAVEEGRRARIEMQQSGDQ
jgi:membrane-associated protease RseP (regulator of RpoE activity)